MIAMKPMLIRIITACVIALVPAGAQEIGGFDLSRATIPLGEIYLGGPPRDGIPAIDAPKFLTSSAVTFLKDDDIVLSFTRGGVTRAYPLRILVMHEIVNDTFGQDAVAVTYCPLCGSAMVFDRSIGGKVRRLGVSGLLYQSDVLMYDRETESLWSQLKMQAVSGPEAGKTLNWLASEHLTWKAWRAKHPGGGVLSMDTGHRRNYTADPYRKYFASERTMFPVNHLRTELPNKEWVIGVLINGVAKAYPVSRLPASAMDDSVGQSAVKVSFDHASRHAVVLDAEGNAVPHVLVFWFAWQAFYPQTGLWLP